MKAALAASGQRLAQSLFKNKPVDKVKVRIKGARASSAKEGGSHGAQKAVNGDGKTCWISDANPEMPVTLTAILDGPHYVSMISLEVLYTLKTTNALILTLTLTLTRSNLICEPPTPYDSGQVVVVPKIMRFTS